VAGAGARVNSMQKHEEAYQKRSNLEHPSNARSQRGELRRVPVGA
jgi:hypothetical protein